MTSTTRTTRRGALAAAVAAALCAAPAFASAQAPDQPQPPAGGPGQPPAGGPGMRGPGGPRGMSMLMEGITLSDAQRARVDSVTRAFGERMRAQRDLARVPGQDNADAPRPDSATRAARFTQMRQQMTERNAAIRAVLTPDQQKTFDANVQRMEQMRQQRMQQGGGMGPGARR